MSATSTIELTPVLDVKGAEVRKNDADDLAATQNAMTESSAAVVEKKGTTAVIITTIAGVTIISSLLSGIVTIALPVMARDLEISEALLFW